MTKNDKVTYSDKRIGTIIKSMGHPSCMKIHQEIAAMLRQLMEQRDAARKKLKIMKDDEYLRRLYRPPDETEGL